MISISKQQISDRWDTLPDELLDALVSEANSDFIWKVAGDEHVPEQKIKMVAMTASRVLMGFLHPEDVAEQLQESIGIDKKTASDIQTALIQRIFTPLRPQIDAAYAPLSKFEIGPQIIQENIPSAPIKASIPATPKPSTPATPAPKIISETFSAAPAVGTSPLASNKNTAAPAPAAKPQAKPDTDWSKQTPQAPVVRLGAITPGVPSPAAPSASLPPRTNAGPAPKTPPQKTMSEFERLDMTKKMGGAPATSAAPGTMPTPSVKPPEPGPVIIHESSPSTPQNTPSFQLNLIARDQLAATPKPSESVSKPAVLEFGGPSNGGSQSSRPPVQPSPFSTRPGMPPTPMPPADNGPRNRTEITANPPSGFAPAPKPPIPTPPTAPAQSKPIVKDFLGP
jgi:hypothetical protein